MAAETFGSLILWLVVVAIVVVIAVYLLRLFYRRSTKEIAFVRTGFGGEKVVVSGGAFVIPVLHAVTLVNMTVMRIEIVRREELALITKTRMRVDVVAEFFVKVGSSHEAVGNAAQTLGRRTLEPDGTRDLLEGRFASALRTVAAQMTLEELHEQRRDYAQRVKTVALEGLAQNGLDLESVALVDLDQTDLEFFDSSNAFDAEGLTQLTETIESRRRMRNQIEQRTQVEIRAQNLDAQRKVLDIDRESEYARLEQERDLEVRRTAQRAELARDRAIRDQEGEQAQIAAHEEIEKSRFIQERNLAEARIQNQEDTQHREIARRRAIDEAEMKSREKTEHEQIALDLALEKARINREREQSELEVTRRRALELADIERQIALAAKSVELTKAEADKRRSEITFNQEIESSRIAQDQALDQVRMERERALDALQIAKRQAFEEAEIASGEEIERSRVDTARARAVEAEEQVFTVREREIAERRKLTDLIAAGRENEREALRLTSKADAEKAAATSFAEAVRIAAQGEANADKIKALAAATRYDVDAKGRTQLNEAENLLSDASRSSRFREKLLERIEGIVRESVRPMEKIDGIKILHIAG